MDLRSIYNGHVKHAQPRLLPGIFVDVHGTLVGEPNAERLARFLNAQAKAGWQVTIISGLPDMAEADLAKTKLSPALKATLTDKKNVSYLWEGVEMEMLIDDAPSPDLQAVTYYKPDDPRLLKMINATLGADPQPQPRP